MTRYLAVAVAAAVLAGGAQAQEAAAPSLRPLCADRPGKATPPCILDEGHLQLEVGLMDFARSRDAGVTEDVSSIAAFELRYGLSKRSEVELDWAPWTIDRVKGGGASSRSAGVGDVTLGWRTALTNPDGQGFLASIEPFVSAPTASHHLGAGGWQGGVMLPIAMPLAADFGLGLTPQLQVVRNASGRGLHLAWSGAAGISHAFGPASFGAELWGAVDDDPTGRTEQASFDLTAAYVPPKLPNLQLDAGANAGLNRATPDIEVYVGVSRRF